LITIPIAGIAQPIVLWDLENYQLIGALDGRKAPAFSARFVQGDRQVLTASTDGAARLWDATTGRLRKTYADSPYLIDAALDPSGTLVVTAAGDGVLRFWDVQSARMLWFLPAHDARIAGVHFENTDIVTRGFTGEIARWALPSQPDLARIADDIIRCLPVRYDDDTGGLVEQERRCDN
jgi:WD40 repeat protein